jgi:hypothetical protein
MTSLMLIVLLLILAALCVLIWVLARRNKPAETDGAFAAAGAARREDPFGGATELAGDPRTLKPGDMVEYLGQRLFVRGSLHFREGGYQWSEHFLDDTAGTKRWVSVEEDPDLEVVLWTELPGESLTPSEKTISYEGVEYRRMEHGTAQFRGQGATGVGESGQVEYVDYEGPGGRYLGFERFGGEGWEVGTGERVPNGTLTIYPGS